MVDEFQDTSLARANLVKTLLKEPNTFLYAVGDDWQSINKFAGADLTVEPAKGDEILFPDKEDERHEIKMVKTDQYSALFTLYIE